MFARRKLKESSRKHTHTDACWALVAQKFFSSRESWTRIAKKINTLPSWPALSGATVIRSSWGLTLKLVVCHVARRWISTLYLHLLTVDWYTSVYFLSFSRLLHIQWHHQCHPKWWCGPQRRNGGAARSVLLHLQAPVASSSPTYRITWARLSMWKMHMQLMQL